MNSNSGNKLKFVLRASKIPFILFGIVFGAGVVFLFYNAIIWGQIMDWIVTAGSFLSLLFLIIWLNSFRFVLTDKYVSYESLFTHKTTLSYSEIKKITVAWGADSYWGRFGPTMRLIIQPYNHPEKNNILVNMKVFNRTEIYRAIDILKNKKKTIENK